MAERPTHVRTAEVVASVRANRATQQSALSDPSVSTERDFATLDRSTRQDITSGFTVAGKTFSSSESAQLKWLHLYTARDTIQYPITVPNIDNTEFVDLSSAADVVTYYTALVQHIHGHYNTNVQEKKARRQR